MYDSLGDFDYSCPADLIAQHPLPRRDASRLLILDRSTGSLTHEQFTALPAVVQRGDTMVINTTRVIKARLRATRDNGREAEVLLVRPDSEDGRTWLAMVHPGGKLKAGRSVTFGRATAIIEAVIGGGLRRIRLQGTRTWNDLIEDFGSLPLPPYINRPPDSDDDVRYQTVYADRAGSVAAPTAGLHFTPALLDDVRSRGVDVAEIVLHVGPGTFKPVQSDRIDDHTMHAEQYEVSEDAARVINDRRRAGGRTWAVGTTVTRVLETVADGAEIRPGAGWTDLFIRPPYQFAAVDGLLTNFHLPRSTLLMLVCAFGGHAHVMQAYHTAVRDQYRLYSYGDAMLIR